VIILAFNGGKFRICIPLVSGVRIRERFRTVGRAVVRIAETVEAEIEVSQKSKSLRRSISCQFGFTTRIQEKSGVRYTSTMARIGVKMRFSTL
jgi:hypothetical protein